MADMTVTMRWQGRGREFSGGTVAGPQVVLDGDNAVGPSPMVTLALGLAGCMAIDVLDIARKMRLPVSSLEVVVEGDRRPDPPRRFTALRLKYVLAGVAAADEHKIRHAIDLSRDKYCSVWHSLREDMAFGIELELR